MKLWEKGIDINKQIEAFTIGNDKEMDLYLAKYDVIGTLAHISMLESINLLTSQELKILKKELLLIYNQIIKDGILIEEGVEDIHSQIELLLTQKLGDVGKKIHSGRSRNDQVLLDIKLFMREQIELLVSNIDGLFNELITKSEQNKDILIPGYTHLQVAMPSSFGLWFGAYAEGLSDDLIILESAFKIVNQNPLGSGAGYGSSFPLNRQMVTELLGFDDMNYNVVYAQMGRGKVEKTVAFALSFVAATLSKMANDLCLFNSQNFGFVSLPDEFTTGSSIMPHKKNPDVFELIRAKCNKIQALPNEINFIINNLTSGYFRDLQILKESIFPTFDMLINIIQIFQYAIKNLSVNNNILEDEKYKFIFSVEELNKMVLAGVPFRDAYKQISKEIEDGNFNPSKMLNHTHEGSIGNLCNAKITEKYNLVKNRFPFQKIEKKIMKLLTY